MTLCAIAARPAIPVASGSGPSLSPKNLFEIRRFRSDNPRSLFTVAPRVKTRAMVGSGPARDSSGQTILK
jgi:hypothetical protein